MDNEATPIPATPGEPATAVAPVRRPRTRLMVAILGAAVVIAASIGVSAAMAAGPGDLAAGSGAPVAVDAAFEKFAACMKDHGVDIGTPVVVSTDATANAVTGGTVSVTGSTGSVSVGGTAPTPLDDATFQAANDACMPILDAVGIKSGTIENAAGTGPLGTLESGSLQSGTSGTAVVIGATAAGGDVTKIADDFKAYAACMRSKGVDMPDPVIDAQAGTVQMQVPGDPGSVAAQDANKACSTALPFAPLAVPAKP